MTALDDDMLLVREKLVSALHDELKATLDVARITRAVDVALDVAGVRVLVEAASHGSTAVTEYSSAYPTPPPTVAAAVADFDTSRIAARDYYASIP